MTIDETPVLGLNFLWGFGSEECPYTALIDAPGARARERLPVEASSVFGKSKNTVKPITYDDDVKCINVEVQASTRFNEL